MAEGKQKRVTQTIVLNLYLKEAGGSLRKSHAGELRRLQRLRLPGDRAQARDP